MIISENVFKEIIESERATLSNLSIEIVHSKLRFCETITLYES